MIWNIRQDLKGTLSKELDFLNEGQNGERCSKELASLPYVYVPKVAWDLTSKVYIFAIAIMIVDFLQKKFSRLESSDD